MSGDKSWVRGIQVVNWSKMMREQGWTVPEELAQVVIADMPHHRQFGEIVECLTGLLPLDLAKSAAVKLAKEKDLPLF